MKQLFNLSAEEFDRRNSIPDIKPPASLLLLNQDALKCCAEGSKKLLVENRELLNEIYRSKRKLGQRNFRQLEGKKQHIKSQKNNDLSVS